MWTYYAIRSGREGEVQSLLRHDGGLNAELYHRQNGWSPNFGRFNQLRMNGDLGSTDIITSEEATKVIEHWLRDEPARLRSRN